MPDSVRERLERLPVGTEIGVRLAGGRILTGVVDALDDRALRLRGRSEAIPLDEITDAARRVTTAPPE